MTDTITPVGRLTAETVTSVLHAAVLAPSRHNTQPWRFRCTPDGIDVLADPGRSLPATDPGQRELLMSCGAALLNLRVAIHARGIDPATTLCPRRDEPDLLATVRPFAKRSIDTRIALLAGAVATRRTNLGPFSPRPVPATALNAMRFAAESERAWMPRLDSAQLFRLRELVLAADRAQRGNAAVQRERNTWTGGAPVVAHARGGDEWVLHECGASDPLGTPAVVVIGSVEDGHADRIRVGQAMQKVLLTATAAGLSASFVAPPVEVPSARAELRQVLGGGIWPQIVLRVGYGGPVPSTPRRPLHDVIVGERVRAG
ncbi:nitroreductase family protein [Amycolatopsis sp. CA-230715]|uniref:nitroreductase family protein n=1 Tax=Amycolatopsis sp. CA-230715 TaxID=2745196 RepID=UPI001C0274A4|nr:nitroreductase family protein [Amycolatopsis sp. CA-230715]QWF83991.1 Putative NAD(P)H nitroreductase [Amycolatopsis sp. CA-230715]